MPRLMLTVEDAADWLSVGRTTMYALISAGDIQSVTIGRLRRIPLLSLEEYVSRLMHKNDTDLSAAA
ncbi:MAG TPA: helix-turn-helix domain-containing protein [Pilimelia sp.]|nr:helix-turn-helix domain-containing protein [Pilimelia sp.]